MVVMRFYLSRIYARLAALMMIHSRIPCSKGRIPTDLMTSTDREAPIKNIVIMSPLRAISAMNLPTSG